MKAVALLKPDNDLILQGITCLTSKKDLYTFIWTPECTEVEITKEFSDEYFTYQGLIDFVSTMSAMCPAVDIVVDDVLYKNLDDATRTLQQYKQPEEFIYALECNPTRVMQTISELCKYYFEVHEDSSIASNKLATLLMKVQQLEKEIANKDERLKKVEALNNETQSKLHALVSRVNFQYEKTVDESVIFELYEHQYMQILYFKEITRVNYTDTLIYYLSEIIRTMYSEPVRSVVIGPYYAYKQASLYPGYKPHWELSYKDVYSENIYMAGLQPTLMGNILQNPNHVHYLIILDRSGLNAPIINGDRVSLVYTVSDVNDAPEVNKKRLISYSPTTLNIPYIENFANLSNEERIQKYSTMPIMKMLVDILERKS